ncbi:MAG: hypothetical protein F4Z53_02450 [Acidimicrobiales bacterium]|nr:hypothetical protein [Acidimicrobiales bacterium]MYD34885.1 hypothetical protein [Acidimicrobiales bacterium]MYI09667.1 hypothetical protein [Acidimicrobiales bacterium]
MHKSTDQVPYYAWRYRFTLDAAATLDLDAVSAGDPHVYITDSEGTVPPVAAPSSLPHPARSANTRSS